jgi:hypothetical protein
MYVDNKLERFRDCLLNYRYPDKKQNIYSTSNETPIHDEYSHAMRALEYYFTNVDTGGFLSKNQSYHLPQNDVNKWTFE